MTPAEGNLQIAAAILGSEPDAEAVQIAIGLARAAVAFADGSPGGATWLGDGRVRIGGAVIELSGRDASIVQAMVELRAATTRELIVRSGYEDAVRYLRRVVEKHPELAPHIQFPGRERLRGYRTTIEDGTA